MIKAYISQVAMAAFLFCVPKFFESKIAHKTEGRDVLDPITNMTHTVRFSESPSSMLLINGVSKIYLLTN